MNDYTKAEKLSAIYLNAAADTLVEGYAKPGDRQAAKIAQALRTGSDCSCLQCGSGFWRKANEIARGDNKYCSRACYGKSQIGKPKPSFVPLAAIEAAALKRKSMTHCKQGHKLSGDNIFTTTAGARGCKECRKLHKAAYRERNA